MRRVAGARENVEAMASSRDRAAATSTHQRVQLRGRRSASLFHSSTSRTGGVAVKCGDVRCLPR